MLWSKTSDTRALINNVSFGDIQHLGMSCTEQGPSVSFLYDLCLLTADTGANLTVVEILFQGPSNAAVLRCGQFLHYVRALRARPRLRRVAIILTGYSFTLSADDVEDLAMSWPRLEVLHLSFKLYYYLPGSIANFQHTLPLLCQRCPDLRFLHLPGLATYPGQNMFILPDMLDSHLLHISSDALVLRYHPIDIAFALCAAFPRLVRLGLPGVGGDSWHALSQLLSAFIQKDYAFLLEHTANFMRAGVYVELP